MAAARGPRLFLATFQHDAAIFALVLFLYVAAQSLGSDIRPGMTRITARIFSKLCMLALVLVLVIYAADVFAFHFFGTRLYAADIVTFSSEHRAIESLLRSGLRATSGDSLWKDAIEVLVIFLWLRAFYLLLAKPQDSPLPKRFLVGAAVLLTMVWLVPVPGYVYSFYDRALYQNFIERNESFFTYTNFSDAFRARILATPEPETIHPGRQQRLNVILVMVESFSAYNSKFFSGLADRTPCLDKIAESETALTNFYANGWTTIGGLVSLVGGTFPFVPEHTKYNPFGAPTLGDYMDVSRPIARVLSDQGYATEYVAGGDLEFIGQDRWLKGVGFKKIIGSDDPRFAGQKIRGPFNSVPDRLLFQIALKEVAQMPVDKPFFMVVQTFWSHRPFTDQNGGSLNGEDLVIRQTDAQIGAFYEGLQATGFLQKGLLFITADHRAPEEFQKAEFDRFGASAVARIPALIATRAVALPHLITQDFQQRDFAASIESLVSDRYYLRPQEGTFLSDPPTPPGCILHSRALDRDLIFVKCGTEEGFVRVAGDATRFTSGAVPDEALIIQTIDRTRARPFIH